jgi:hypothetical protein
MHLRNEFKLRATLGTGRGARKNEQNHILVVDNAREPDRPRKKYWRGKTGDTEMHSTDGRVKMRERLGEGLRPKSWARISLDLT